MAEAGEDGAAARGDDPFERIREHLKAILADLGEIERLHIMIMSGSDFVTLGDVANDERDLERDIRILQRRIEAHYE